jgi:hypothetical protein
MVSGMASLTDADVLAGRGAGTGEGNPAVGEPADAERSENEADTKLADELSAASGVEDPLLDCLVYLTAHFGNPKSPDVLKAGLPHSGEALSASMFVRASERVGLSARIVKRRLGSINKLVLPAVLILKDARACILAELPDKRRARIVSTETGGGTQDVDVKDLAEDYSGYAIYLRPITRLEPDGMRSETPKPSAWFWGTIASNWWSYAQVVLAASLINMFALATPLFIMTVYDRVVPNNAVETLWVLATGVLIVFLFDFILKGLRGYFIDAAGKRADVLLASRIFEQVMDMKMVARPGSAGAFANNLREFETLRDFFTSATLAAVVDLPFVVFFVFIIWLVGGEIAQIHLVAVPLVLTDARGRGKTRRACGVDQRARDLEGDRRGRAHAPAVGGLCRADRGFVHASPRVIAGWRQLRSARRAGNFGRGGGLWRVPDPRRRYDRRRLDRLRHAKHPRLGAGRPGGAIIDPVSSVHVGPAIAKSDHAGAG